MYSLYVLSKNSNKFEAKIRKKIQLKIIIFTAFENRCILHGRVNEEACSHITNKI